MTPHLSRYLHAQRTLEARIARTRLPRHTLAAYLWSDGTVTLCARSAAPLRGAGAAPDASAVPVVVFDGTVDGAVAVVWHTVPDAAAARAS